ncbi:hypothetical protein LAZ67_10004098 [Cordylochernes scorpioides]|uniref:CCHC-type domain-containing protein n=1 Tax=Cordylochernes scorpioides TaxID=51811 RepID=A0ABY6KXE6_9ARAC|nr:hypothetical protein LAZ67_10004098 [Cordylochernes scorpioides]
MATNLARAESPSNAEQKPVRHGAKAQPCAELSKKEDFQKKTSNLFNKNQNYANPPAGGHHANPATPTDFVTASFSEAAAQANRSWADLAEDNNQESEDPFITVQRKKRRRGSAESPAAAAPSSNIRGAGAIRRPRSSTGWAPRAEEIRTTRAHIAEARARQASSTEDHCVYVERSPELEPFHYMRAIERMFGGTREVFQLTKMNGHFLVGLANRGMAERLINEGLEVEGTLHRAFPFRKRAERITVGNLPFFVGDAAVISALSSFGRVTSIAPKLMKAGPYIYNDGRREAFIILREGMTIERLPTRLDITIKGEAWPAYLSSGIRCSRCRGQGHRRANCPLLARRTTAPGPATPTSPTSVPPATAPRLPQQPSAQPPPPASPSPTMEVSDVPPTSRAALHPPAALRQSSPAPSALPAEDAPLAPPPMTPAPSLRTPGSREPAAPTPDVEMSIVEETSASFTSTAKNATRIDLDAFIERHPSVSFAETDALGLGREEVLDLLSSRTKTQRSVPLLPLSQCNALAGLIRQILDLRPGAASNLYKVLGQVKAELRTTPAAVPPTPPLPAPRPAEPMLPTTHREELTPPLMTPPPPAPTDMEEDDPMTEKERDTPPPPAPRLAETTPPIPHGEKTSPHIATPPPPLSCQFIDDRWTEADDILYELNQERDWGVGISESDITEAVIYPEDREPLIRRLSTRRRSLLAAFISAAIERARDADPFVVTSVPAKCSIADVPRCNSADVPGCNSVVLFQVATLLACLLGARAVPAGYAGAYAPVAPLAPVVGGPYHGEPVIYDDVYYPKPYSFGYQTVDDFGGSQSRDEKSDGAGGVVGSYGYTDPHGIYRKVDYVADDYGFRADVKTNEPGTANQDPAGVAIYSDAPVVHYEPVAHGPVLAPAPVVHGPVVAPVAPLAHGPIAAPLAHGPIAAPLAYGPIGAPLAHGPIAGPLAYGPIGAPLAHGPIAGPYADVHGPVLRAPLPYGAPVVAHGTKTVIGAGPLVHDGAVVETYDRHY